MKNRAYRLLWITSGFAAANLALFGLMFRKPKKRWEQDAYDCAGVCGCQVGADGTPSKRLAARVEKAVELWKDKKVKYLIMSGAAVSNTFVEASVMKRYAMELGVPEEYILEEKQAVSTYHNLLYASQMMEHCGFKDCVVVTNGWHLRKADHYARKAGVKYVMAASKRPEGDGLLTTIGLYLKTDIHMYVNMWKGYY